MRITFTDRLSAKTINESSALTVVAKFWDDSTETWTASAPTSVKYRLDDQLGGQITDWTTVTAAASVTITIPGSSNAIIDDWQDTETKQLTIRANDGLSTQHQDIYTYRVKNLSGQ